MWLALCRARSDLRHPGPRNPDPDYIRVCGGNPSDLSLLGQENMGAIWSVRKMNILVHGIDDTNIRQEDTLRLIIPADAGDGFSI